MAHVINEDKIRETIRRFNDNETIPLHALRPPDVGGQSIVYRVYIPGRVDWAVRIPVRLSVAAAKDVIEVENTLLRRLEVAKFPWSPRVLGEEVNDSNNVGFPFSVYNWLPGKPLRWNNMEPPSLKVRQRFLRQFAQAFLSLISCTRVNDTEHEDFADHVTRVTDNRIVRICRGQLPFRVRDCFQHRKLLFDLLQLSNNAPRTRFVGHNDLAAQNILVDDDFNLTGIIDWTFAAEEPWQLAASLPAFLRPSESDVLGLAEQDRTYVVETLLEQTPVECHELVSAVADMWSRPDFEYLQQMLDGVGRIDCFEQVARDFPDLKLADAEDGIAAFLTRRGSNANLRKENIMAKW